MDRPPLRSRLRLRTAPPKASEAWRVLFPDDPTSDAQVLTNGVVAAMTPAELIAARLHAHRITSAVDRAYRAAEAVQAVRPGLTVAIEPTPGTAYEPGKEFTPGGPFMIRFLIGSEGQADLSFSVPGHKTSEEMRRDLEHFAWELLDAHL